MRTQLISIFSQVASKKKVMAVNSDFMDSRDYIGWLMINDYMLNNELNDYALEKRETGKIDYNELVDYINIQYFDTNRVFTFICDCMRKGLLVYDSGRTFNPILENIVIENPELNSN